MGFYEFNVDDAVRFAREQGIRIRSMHGSEIRFAQCPYCRNKTDDKNTFAINKKTGAFNCKRASCGAKGNMITLAKDFGFSINRDVDAYLQRGPCHRDLSRYPKPIVRTPAVTYMEVRGISKAVTESYGITTQTDHDNVLVFPFFDEDGKMRFVKYRKTDFDKDRDSSKEWCESNCRPILFGMDHCDPEASKVLVMTEGQIDSLSVTEAGIPNAVSVPLGKNGFTWVPYCWDFLCRFDELIVFGDHERGEITLLDEMAKRFKGRVKHVREEDYLDCKDANDLLRKHGKDAVRNAVKNAVLIANPRIKKLSSVKRRDMTKLEHFNTGIAALNSTIGGFYFGQLVLLTGERGFGKSTLASQFGLFAIQNRYTTFFYSGELMDWYFQDWFDRQCAGAEHINKMESNLGFMNYIVRSDRVDKIHAWYDERCYIYDNSIVKEVSENETLLKTLETAIKQYGCRVLILDNLMTAIDDDVRSDLYRQQSAFVLALSSMAKAWNVLIILVAHPRKTLGGEYRNDDVSGSGNITNLADIVLRYGKPKRDSHIDAPRVLQVTKNRINGKVDFEGIPLWYEESSKRIAETKDGFDWLAGWEGDEEDGFLSMPEDEELPFI